MPEPVDGTSPYLAGLDGLRAIAVLAVIAYHLGLHAVPGGLLGVGVFFVLSGYLITDLLVGEHQRAGRIAFRHFWARRARRLLPALGVVLLTTVTWVTLFDRVELTRVRSDLAPALLYVSNWWFIFRHVSYFARFGPPSPLGHLWSLAIEEQFYLVAPILLLVGLRHLRTRRALVGAVLALAAASAVEMAMLYVPGGNPTRVYDGTDTRAFALLIGVALALVWPRTRAGRALPARASRLLQGAGLISLAGIAVMFTTVGQYDPFLYRGGMVLLSVLTAIVIAATVHLGSGLQRALGIAPMRWIGKRSYGIYLWHYPVIVLTTPVGTSPGAWRAAAQVTASVLLAALTWRYVEQPIRHGGFQRAWVQTRRVCNELRSRRQLGTVGRAGVAAGTATLLAGAVSAAGLAGLVNGPALAPSPQATVIMPSAPAGSSAGAGAGATTAPASTGRTASGRAGSAKASGTSTASPTASASPSNAGPATTTNPATATDPATATAPPPGSSPGSSAAAVPSGGGTSAAGSTSPAASPARASTPQAPAAPQPGSQVTAIGDSVLIDAAPYLDKLLPGIAIDAKVGQQLDQVPPDVPTLRALGAERPVLVIELGTNGPYAAGQLTALLDSMGPPQHVVLVNTRVPKPWEQQVNSTIATVAHAFPHTTVVDWYTASANHPEYFYPDGVHLDPVGAQRYADLIAQAVDQALG